MIYYLYEKLTNLVYIMEQYPDMRYHEEKLQAELYKEEHGEYPTYPVGDDKDVVYPEGFKIISSRVFTDKNGKEYKQVHLQDEKGQQHTALAFNSYADYDKLNEGNYVDGYIRIHNSKFSLVDYCKPERSLLDGEIFISPNGEVISK